MSDSITDDINESKINPSSFMPPALIKATYNDNVGISHFSDSVSSLSKEIQFKSKYTEEDIVRMLEFLVDNIFVVFAGKVF